MLTDDTIAENGPTPDEQALIRADFAAMGRTFRGTIWENAMSWKLTGPAYKSMPPEQGGHFWIESAPQCRGPLVALNDPAVRHVGIIGATQVLKSIVGNVWVPHVAEHDPADMLILFEIDEKAKAFAEKRLMPTLRAHPRLWERFEEESESRHELTKTKIISASMNITVGGLNDTNVSTFSYRYIWVSESWQHGADGMLRKAIARADRYPHDQKILIESQAGLAGEDLHQWFVTAHPVPLTWACPHCSGRQEWEFSQQRPAEFKATKPTPNPSKEGNGIPDWIGEFGVSAEAYLSEPKPDSYAGMKFAPAEIEVGGHKRRLTLEERARTAYWECYHCGGVIQDRRDVRKAIAKTYEQEYRITQPSTINSQPSTLSPKRVAFVIPKEAAWDNSFENSAKSFLLAQEAERMGNLLPLRDWYLSERAKFFDPQMAAPESKLVIGTWDTQAIIKDEHSRNMAVDVQKKLDTDEDVPGSFWYEAEAVDKLGNSYQLARGFATSLDDVLAVKEKFKIPNHRFCIDGRKWTPTIMQWAAEHFEWVKGTMPGVGRFRSTWKILLGDDARYYRWNDRQSRAYGPAHAHEKYIIENGKPVAVRVFTHLWSNLAVKDQLHTMLLGGEGMPKVHVLKRDQLDERTREMEQGDRAYERQMSAEYRTQIKGKDIWEKKRPDNHYWDVRCMLTVRKMMDGLIGTTIAPEKNSTTDEN